MRYRAHLKVVHGLLLAVPAEAQYFPLARSARQHYRDTGTVAPIAVPVIDQVDVDDLEVESVL
jgi:hypothetical protein